MEIIIAKGTEKELAEFVVSVNYPRVPQRKPYSDEIVLTPYCENRNTETKLD